MDAMTEGHIVIQRSVSKIVGLIAIGTFFLAISVWLIRGGAIDSRGEVTLLWGWLGTIFFGLCLFLSIHILLFGYRTPVELSPQGFWDRRILKQEVPWSLVSRISIWSHGRISLLRIQLTDGAITEEQLTSMGKRARWLNKAFGLDGIYVDSMYLEISFSELSDLFQKYLEYYNPSAVDSTR